MKKKNTPANRLFLPVVSLSAEYLTIGNLMRRNIMAYKAPPNNEGYDLICIHPDAKNENNEVIKVQVKSRYQTDSDRTVPLKEESFKAFHFLILVFINVGYFFLKDKSMTAIKKGIKDVEFYVLPVDTVKELYTHVKQGFNKVHLKKLNNPEDYKNDKGFELIAKKLGIKYPSRQTNQCFFT